MLRLCQILLDQVSQFGQPEREGGPCHTRHTGLFCDRRSQAEVWGAHFKTIQELLPVGVVQHNPEGVDARHLLQFQFVLVAGGQQVDAAQSGRLVPVLFRCLAFVFFEAGRVCSIVLISCSSL